MKTKVLFAICTAGLQFLAYASEAQTLAQPGRVGRLDVIPGCVSYPGDPQPTNVTVQWLPGGPVGPAGWIVTFQNTSGGQSVSFNGPLQPNENRYPVPAGTFDMIVSQPGQPLSTVYKGISIAPYTVVTENGKQVCKAKPPISSGGQKR